MSKHTFPFLVPYLWRHLPFLVQVKWQWFKLLLLKSRTFWILLCSSILAVACNHGLTLPRAIETQLWRRIIFPNYLSVYQTEVLSRSTVQHKVPFHRPWATPADVYKPHFLWLKTSTTADERICKSRDSDLPLTSLIVFSSLLLGVLYCVQRSGLFLEKTQKPELADSQRWGFNAQRQSELCFGDCNLVVTSTPPTGDLERVQN